MKKYIVYITINKLDTSKCYIGFTNGNKKYYLGSGLLILKAIKKYGKSNFYRADLGVFEDKDEAHYWEGFYIKTLKTLVSQGGYNISPTGGLNVVGCFSDETKRKLSENNGMKKPEARKKLSESRKGMKFSKEHLRNMAIASSNRIVTEETKQKLRNAALNQWQKQKLTK